MQDKLLKLVNEVLETEGRKTVETFNSNTSLRRDLGFDSLELAILTVKIEDEFGVDIFENGNIDTIEEVLRCIENA